MIRITTSGLLFLSLAASAADGQAHAHGHDWDQVYRAGTSFSLKPNALLASTVSKDKPGKALDIGMGQGRNALFLAGLGWKVTGVDLSEEGVRIARQAAAKAKVPLDAVVADLADYELGNGRYDLVALIYFGASAPFLERVKTALAPGGKVVIEYYHQDMEAVFKHPMGAFKTGQLDALFAGYEILRSEVVEDIADFGMKKAKLVRFVAQKPSESRPR